METNGDRLLLFLASIIHSVVFQAGVVSAMAAAHIDYDAFKKMQTPQEVLTYNWGVAVWRIFKGFVIGVVSASTMGQFVPTSATFGA
jgi:hypothetical protein